MKILILLIFSLICISCNSEEKNSPKSQFKYAEYSNWNDSAKQNYEWEIKAFLVKRFDIGTCFGNPSWKLGMSDSAYEKNKELIKFIEKIFGEKYERKYGGYSLDHKRHASYTKIDIIIEQMDLINIDLNRNNKILATFKSGRESEVFYYKGEIFIYYGYFEEEIKLIKIEKVPLKPGKCATVN